MKLETALYFCSISQRKQGDMVLLNTAAGVNVEAGFSVAWLLAVLIVPNVTLLISFIILTKVTFAKQEGQITALDGKVDRLEERLSEKDNEHKAALAELKRVHERELETLQKSTDDVRKRVENLQDSFNRQMMDLSNKITSATTAMELAGKIINKSG